MLGALCAGSIASAPVKFLSARTLCAAILLTASVASASNVAPNIEVTVKQASRTLFKGITDASGRFFTTPLEPGVYTFELRRPKTALPAQYFLLLSGAKPVSPATSDRRVVLRMHRCGR